MLPPPLAAAKRNGNSGNFRPAASLSCNAGARANDQYPPSAATIATWRRGQGRREVGAINTNDALFRGLSGDLPRIDAARERPIEVGKLLLDVARRRALWNGRSVDLT